MSNKKEIISLENSIEFKNFLSTLTTKSANTLKAVMSQENNPIWNLRLIEKSELFSDEEIQFINSLDLKPFPKLSSLRSHMVLIVKVTRNCNLRCVYCNAWREDPEQIMSFKVLAKLIHNILSTPGIKEVDFVWHGGEVTLLNTKILKKALWLQQHYCRPYTKIHNSIQTNGTHLTKEWVDFLYDYNFSVGVSIDGPSEIHDKKRVTATGKGTWKTVNNSIKLLREKKIPFGILAVVDESVIQYGANNYLSYLSKLNVKSIAFLNVLPPNDFQQSKKADYLNWNYFIQFLRSLFNIWWSEYRNLIVIRELQALVDSVKNNGTGLCLFSENCMGQYLTIEPDGNISACDKYVGDKNYIFGNIINKEINEMISSSQHLTKAQNIIRSQKKQMYACENFKYCSGGCGHDIRLNKLYLNDWNSSCCGLYELIEDIKKATQVN